MRHAPPLVEDLTGRHFGRRTVLRRSLRAALEALVWADGALDHAWRLAESLRIASGN